MKKVDDVLKKMQEEIDKVKEFAKDKTKDIVDEETKEKARKLVEKTTDVIENAKVKVTEVAKDVKDDEKFNAFLNNVTIKVQEASDFTKTKISELIPEKEKIDDIQKQLDESFDKLKESDGVKTVIVSIQKVEDAVKDYLAKPETKAKINKAKATTLNIAEKGMERLRKLLASEEETTEEQKEDKE